MVNRTAIAALTALIVCVSAPAFGSEGWYPSYDDALAVAKRDNIPLVIHFHASWCGPCRTMNSQVLSQPAVKRQLRTGIAAVELDITKHPKLASKYGATTVPRDVVVLPDGTHQTLNIGAKSTHAYLALLREAARRGAGFTRPAEPDPEPTAIVGLEGFCPVQLIRDRKWVSGSKQLAEDYRGITYLFSSKEARDEFQANPAKYSPQNLGCDPVVLYADQQAVNGRISYGVFFDSKLYLFKTSENRSKFKQNPLKYSLIRHAVKADELSARRFN